jgi:HAD superfamily phosphatase (TIGR01668 family)
LGRLRRKLQRAAARETLEQIQIAPVLSLITPNLQLDSVLDLHVDRLRNLGLQTLLLDVDCTLKDYHSTSLNDGVLDWIMSLQTAGIRLCLLSNGGRARIEKLATQIGTAYVARALKPFPFGCWSALRQLAAEKKHTAVVGDQLFADVMAGRLAGLFTILVRPTTTAEPWFTSLKRPLERRMLARMNSRAQIVSLPPAIQSKSGAGRLSPRASFEHSIHRAH